MVDHIPDAPLSTDDAWAGRIHVGTWRTASATAPVVEPATGQVLGNVGIASPDDVAEAATLAASAHRAWVRTAPDERAAVLHRAAAVFEEDREQIADWIVRESGSTRVKAQVEVDRAIQECRCAAALAGEPVGSMLPRAEGGLSFVRRVPVGVVGVISPYNFPLILSINSVAPALALGNAALVKPDPRTAVCGGVVLAQVFERAGLPAGLLSVLPGGADTGRAVVENPEIALVCFTGSTAAGRTVAALAAQHGKRVHLELGGNSALVVLEDADIERAAAAAAWSAFFHQGQICMTPGRHIVHESLADDYLAALVERAQSITMGDPYRAEVAIGPLIDDTQADKVAGIVTAAVDAGARLLAGGRRDGRFVSPTVLADVPTDTAAWHEEVFGPVAPVRTFADEADALRLAQDSRYGLVVSVLTSDPMRGLELASQVSAGVVHVNDHTVADNAHVPFGGTGDSGNGARLGSVSANQEAFTTLQWVTVDRTIPAY